MAAVVSRSRHHLRLGSRHGWKPRLQHETQTMLLHGLLWEPFFRRTVECMPCHLLGRSSWRQDGILPLPQFRCPVQDPPKTSQPLQTPNAGGNRGTRRSPVFALVMALPSTELHDYFALCSVLAVHFAWIKACSKWRRIHADVTARSQWAHWRAVFSCDMSGWPSLESWKLSRDLDLP